MCSVCVFFLNMNATWCEVTWNLAVIVDRAEGGVPMGFLIEHSQVSPVFIRHFTRTYGFELEKSNVLNY